MKLSEKQILFTSMVGRLLRWCAEEGHDVVLEQASRPPELQAIYLERGLSKTLNSKHCQKLAIDLTLFVGDLVAQGGAYLPIGEYWESLGGVWGGRWTGFVDAVHFQNKDVDTDA